MRAAVICCGPSVRQTFDDDFSGLRIGVNRAALWYACDVWAANDYPLIRDVGGDVLGKPTLWTNKDTLTSLHNRDLWPDAFPFASLPCPVPAWHLYTAPAALVVAAHLGATAIDVYGADWTDAPDADGKLPPGCVRDRQRWENERAIWFAVVAWLKLPVERILP